MYLHESVCQELKVRLFIPYKIKHATSFVMLAYITQSLNEMAKEPFYSDTDHCNRLLVCFAVLNNNKKKNI